MLVDLIALVGVLLIAVGAWLAYPPLALVVLGLALLAFAYVLEAARVDRRPPPG